MHYSSWPINAKIGHIQALEPEETEKAPTELLLIASTTSYKNSVEQGTSVCGHPALRADLIDFFSRGGTN